MTASIDAPGTRCAFGVRCSLGMAHHGGFDAHHEWPKSMGGADGQSTMLTLCPNHHRRQHALIRYLVERDGQVPDPLVLRHYRRPERDAAWMAFTNWVQAGRPHVADWPCPAAR